MSKLRPLFVVFLASLATPTAAQNLHVAGKVGIATTSPSVPLHVASRSGQLDCAASDASLGGGGYALFGDPTTLNLDGPRVERAARPSEPRGGAVNAANLARAGILLLWVGLPPAVAHAGDLRTRGAGLSADRNDRVGTLEVTRDTPPVMHTGDLAIRSVDTAVGCDGFCGDGVVNGLEECDWADNTPECTSNCRILRFREYGGTSPYLDDFRDLQPCRDTPSRVSDNVGHREVTFFTFGDTQYGNNDAQAQPPILAPGIKNNRPDMNRRHIEALNQAQELS